MKGHLFVVAALALFALAGCGRTELDRCPGGDCTTQVGCPAGACDGGQPDAPVCPSGQDLCGDTCVDLGADSANCGACANACDPGQSCKSGRCG